MTLYHTVISVNRNKLVQNRRKGKRKSRKRNKKFPNRFDEQPITASADEQSTEFTSDSLSETATEALLTFSETPVCGSPLPASCQFP